MPTIDPEDEEWDWICDPEGLAETERLIAEIRNNALDALEGLFDPDGAKEFVERELGYAEGEGPGPWLEIETPESRALKALSKSTRTKEQQERMARIIDKIVDEAANGPREDKQSE